jgi:amino acid transporter
VRKERRTPSMKILGILIVLCGAGVGVMVYNIQSYWKKNKETPLADKARGMQIRMTVIPVLLVLICLLTLLMKRV